MGQLTTHVLDTAQGKPGGGILVELYSAAPNRRLVGSARTNDDGRCDAPSDRSDRAAGRRPDAFRTRRGGAWKVGPDDAGDA